MDMLVVERSLVKQRRRHSSSSAIDGGSSSRSEPGYHQLMALLAVAAALLLTGVFYQLVGSARARRRFTPPGVLVDAGGHRLHAVCRGSGRPLVLLESGIAASSLSWSAVQPAIAAFTRACAYNRAGLAWSDPPSSPRSFARIVDELAVVLNRIAPGERIVLVGHSFGSFIVRAYAARRPGIAWWGSSSSGSGRGVAAGDASAGAPARWRPSACEAGGAPGPSRRGALVSGSLDRRRTCCAAAIRPCLRPDCCPDARAARRRGPQATG